MMPAWISLHFFLLTTPITNSSLNPTMNFPRLLSLLLAALALAPAPSMAASNSVVRIVNGRPILKSEVDDLMRARMVELQRTATTPDEFRAQLAEMRKTVLEMLTDQELILAEFQPIAASYDAKVEAMAEEMVRKQFVGEMFKGDRKKFLKALQDGGISYKKFFEQQKKNVIVETMRSQFARPETEYITEEEKAAWLRKNSQRFRSDPKVKLWSITIPAVAFGKTPQQQLELAREIRASLLKGADFAALARTHSTDSVRDEGGSRGWQEKETFPARALWPAIAKIPAGKYSDVIPYQENLYVFWAEAREEGKMAAKEEVEKAVERGVMAEKRQKAADKWIAELRRKAVIRTP
jgi:peptidyl-prolyl cis-trans isomerase SurA